MDAAIGGPMMSAPAAVCWLVVTLVVIVACTEAIRRLPAWMGLALFIAIPTFMAPIWLTADVPLFRIVKTYSVCLGGAWMQGLKIGGNAQRPWLQRVAWAILAVNILEAAVTDLQEARPINAIAGLLLIVAQPGPGAFGVARGAGTIDLEYRLTGVWVAAYTVWNLAFIVGTAPTYAVLALGHLVGPILAARGRPELWVQARTIGLAILMFDGMSATGPPWLPLVNGWEDPRIYPFLALPALGLALAAVVTRTRDWRAERRPRADTP
jgi:hypothetical protein